MDPYLGQDIWVLKRLKAILYTGGVNPPTHSYNGWNGNRKKHNKNTETKITRNKTNLTTGILHFTF